MKTKKVVVCHAHLKIAESKKKMIEQKLQGTF